MLNTIRGVDHAKSCDSKKCEVYTAREGRKALRLGETNSENANEGNWKTCMAGRSRLWEGRLDKESQKIVSG